MVSKKDMSTPVTRGELRQELGQLRQEFKTDLERFATNAELKFATKTDLELWGGALLARIELSEKRLGAELARHVQAVYEAMSRQISASHEVYSDLPGGVKRLETAVFVPK